jgi:putative nucleotidyltransferase with HDIG domain
MATIEALINALEAKDRYTAGHSRRVAELATALGQKLSLTREELDELRWGSLFHDIGKIAIDPKIQNKPNKLTHQEYVEVMRHVTVGPRIVKPISSEKMLIIIGHHHDHYDGSGYCQLNIGEQIPVDDRILSIADAFDAMISTRPYRDALPVKKALAEIRQRIGGQFDPFIARTFLKIPVHELLAMRVNIGMADWRYTSCPVQL